MVYDIGFAGYLLRSGFSFPCDSGRCRIRRARASITAGAPFTSISPGFTANPNRIRNDLL